MSGAFAKKVAIVTGGASGIGLATVKRLAAEGAAIGVVDLDGDRCRAAVGEARGAGAPDAVALPCDVSHGDQVTAAVRSAIDALGRLDVVVNNAGLMSFRPIEELETEDWMRILAVDLLGAFYFTKQAFLTMRRGGAIVNVSSIHAVETTPGVAPYAAAKAALVSLTRSTALEGKPRGIRANVVLPGAVDTPMLWSNPNVKAGLEKIERSDVGRPQDVADVIAWLASDQAAFVWGAAIRVDGGRLTKL
ncbi:MAG TPA: SDR family NAD(P)-dependent oxidoreductase [Candidatus Polarisedimenticolaceae bacterium]|nr:SDR family NAD(P)-dependent oxidoreductase [Candidatus Polarisedimenticolaceae bacterium]